MDSNKRVNNNSSNRLKLKLKLKLRLRLRRKLRPCRHKSKLNTHNFRRSKGSNLPLLQPDDKPFQVVYHRRCIRVMDNTSTRIRTTRTGRFHSTCKVGYHISNNTCNRVFIIVHNNLEWLDRLVLGGVARGLLHVDVRRRT